MWLYFTCNYCHNYNSFNTHHCLQRGETALDIAKRLNYHKYVKILEDAMVCELCNFHHLWLHVVLARISRKGSIIVTCMCNIYFNINLVSYGAGATFFKKFIAFNDSLLVNTNNQFVKLSLYYWSTGWVVYVFIP